MATFRASLLIAALTLVASAVSAAPIWDTMPTGAGPKRGYAAIDEGMVIQEWAAGFTVESAGYITRIQTAITPVRTSLPPLYGSQYGFVIGISDNSLIGNPSPPQTSGRPAGSLWQTGVCSTTPVSAQGGASCNRSVNTSPGSGLIKVAHGELVNIEEDIFLPAAGTYWLYLHVPLDDSVASWGASEQIDTNLVASRSGPNFLGVFNQTAAPRAAPGMRIEFNAVPEPQSLTLAVVALCAITITRRRQRSPKSTEGGFNKAD